MSLRAGHGNGRGTPRIEVLPANELPPPLPSASAPPDVALAFRQDGKIADSATARELGRLGGLAKARRLRLVDSLGLAKIAEDSAFLPYRNAADEFVAHHVAELAQSSGGKVGPAPSTMIASAALQLAGSRYAFDQFAQTADASWMKLGSQMADASRQNLLAAFEIAVREAKAREGRTPLDPLAGYMSLPRPDSDAEEETA